MKQSIFSLPLGAHSLWICVAFAGFVVFAGLAGSAEAATQNDARAIDNMYACINSNSVKAQKSIASSGGDSTFRASLSNDTLKAIAERKAYLNNDKQFSTEGLNQKYQKLDKLVDAGNKSLDGKSGKVEKPKYHIENIKTERDNLFAQLDSKAAIARDTNTPTDKLITNHCETSWGLRIYVVPNRKWQAQIDTDTLSTKNAVAKAYWIAAQKPAAKDPSQFDKQINQFQQELDALVIPRVGLVNAGPLNPKDANAHKAFKERIFDPQKNLSKKIIANSQDLKKATVTKTAKATNKNKYNYVQLPENNELYYIYGSSEAKAGDGGETPPYERYGTPALVKTFQDVALRFNKKYPEIKLVAGDLDAVAGHESHKNGIDMDVYVQNHMAADMRGGYRTKESVDRSVVLGKMFIDTKKIDVIFYNDPAVISEVNSYAKKNKLPGHMETSNSTHEFHFHVRLKTKPGPYDSCATANAAKDCFR